MKTITYSKDVDTLLIELSNEAIAFAEDEGNVILHYSQDDKLILVEILDFRRLLSSETVIPSTVIICVFKFSPSSPPTLGG
ncbi:MAG: DUF2283 domain-containing protein, partial [Microcystaceae cyanobacterium]